MELIRFPIDPQDAAIAATKRLCFAITFINSNDEDKLWFNPEQIKGVIFTYNDIVKIKSGEYIGERAWVISLMPGEPISYLVELDGSGGDIEIAQSELERDK